MPYCPNCRLEYQPHAKFCTDCQVALVDQLPLVLHPKFSEGRTVVVHQAQSEEEGRMLEAMLKAQGIPSVVRSLQIPGYHTLLQATGSSWGVLEVFESQANDARDLIAAYLSSQRWYS